MPRGLKSRQKRKPRKIQIPASQTDKNSNNNVSKTDISYPPRGQFFQEYRLYFDKLVYDTNPRNKSNVNEKFELLCRKTFENLRLDWTVSDFEYMYQLHTHTLHTTY